MSTALIILTGVLTLINSVMLALNIISASVIIDTVDRIELYILELFLKECKENND